MPDPSYYVFSVKKLSVRPSQDAHERMWLRKSHSIVHTAKTRMEKGKSHRNHNKI